MKLRFCTLTGADDTIQTQELVELSREFPFVEWGILIGSGTGTPRFPSPEWLTDLQRTVWEARRGGVLMNMAVHICGKYLREMLQTGRVVVPENVRLTKFDRAQLNFHAKQAHSYQVDNLIQALEGETWITKEVIIQLDEVNDRILDRCMMSRSSAEFSGLYDVSHGAGVSPSQWPRANPKWKVGYAGGIGPDNVVAEMRRIEQVCGEQPTWIDMETKLYDEKGVFDLGKCRQVLEQVRLYAFS